jgi:adenylate cyclase
MNHRFNALALGLMIGLTGVLAIALAPWVHVEEDLGLAWLFNMRGPVEAPGDVVVVAIDELSAQKLGLPDKPRDWPRAHHAQLVRYLSKAGARVIGFDLTFDAASAVAGHDQEFADALSQAGNVLMTASIREETIRLHSSAGRPVGNVVIEKPAPPIPIIANAALGHAPFLLPKSSRVNTYWTFRGGAGDAPMFPVLAFQVYVSSAFNDFLALRHKVEPDLAPPAAATQASGPSIAEIDPGTIRALRESLLKDPGISAAMWQLLHESREGGLTQETTRRIESLINLYSSSETTYLNFYGPPRSIDTVPYFRVLEAAQAIDSAGAGALDPGRFKDKVVFVGFSAESQAGQDRLHDNYRTVFSLDNGLDLSGVEIAATAFANLLQNRPLRALAPGWQLAIVAAWGLVLGLIFRLLTPIPALGIVIVLAAFYLWLVYDRFAVAALWLPSIIPVGVQAPLALFAGVWLHYRDTKRERELVKLSAGYFLPKGVVDQLARNIGPVTAGNRVVFGACLATDMQNYTSLAEAMDPAKLGELMNEYYAVLFKPVERMGGTVVDVVGDAMVAIWAGSASDSALRANACESALEIIDALDQFNHAPLVRPSLSTRFGLHAGDMLIGSVGASRHFEYRAIGDIVNTASRIQGLNKVLGTRLLASEATVDGLDRLTTRRVGTFLLAGKTTAVALVEILGRSQDDAAQQTMLCAVFAEGLDAYQARRWHDAAAKFSDILRVVPEDGPSRFYLERCERLLGSPPGEEWTPTIRIDSK